jgi:hypothetical protein
MIEPSDTSMPPIEFAKVRRCWIALTGVILFVIVYVAYRTFSQGTEQSQFLFLFLGLVIVLLLSIGALAFWLTPDHLRFLQHSAQPLRTVYTIVGLCLLFILGLLMRSGWLSAIVAFVTATGFFLGYRTLYNNAVPGSHVRRWTIGLAILAILLFAIRIYSLAAYPPIHKIDEGWTLGWAMDYMQTGRISDRLMLNTSAASHSLPFFYGLLGLWLKFTGVGLWEARLFSFILVLVTIGLTMLAARNWYGTETALLTGVILSASAILALGERIRHDIGLAVAVAASVWLFTEAIKRGSKRLHLLAGMAIGFGYFAHYHATFFGAVLAVGFYVPRYVQRLREGKCLPETEFWFYLLGGVAAGGIAFVLQTLPDLQGFLSNRLNISTNLSTMGQMIVHNVFQITLDSQLEALLIILGLAGALSRRKLQDWSLILCIVIGHLALGLDSFRTEYYTVPLTPFYGIAVASLLVKGFQRSETSVSEGAAPKWLQAVPAFSFVIPLLAFTLQSPLNDVVQRRPIQPNPPAPAQWVLDHVSPDKLVIGDHFYFLWLTDYHYGSIGIPELLVPSERSQHATAGEVWDNLQPDVFIVDPTMSSYVTDGQRLLNEHYFESRGFQVAAQFPADHQMITIYERP